eukprot:4428433-Pleurochrysis_carterae.AAC.2
MFSSDMRSPVGKTRSKRPAISSGPSASIITTLNRWGETFVKAQRFTSGAATRGYFVTSPADTHLTS